jgi:hypothetical protein
LLLYPKSLIIRLSNEEQKTKGEMKMDERELASKMIYMGMERRARSILIRENLASVDEVAIMTRYEVCEKLLETYEVVSCEDECITLVKKEDMETYNNIVKCLDR